MRLDEPSLPRQDISARLWWAVPSAGVLVLMALAMLFGSSDTQRQQGTSYDASSKGLRAAYLFLEDLGYPVARSRRATGGSVRFVLFPKSGQKEAEIVDEWVRRGGILVLADDTGEYAEKMGVHLKIRSLEIDADQLSASGPAGVSKLAPGKLEAVWPGQMGRVWAAVEEDSALTVYERGRGQLWLVNRPELFDNKHLRQADNAILLSRLADEVLEKRGGDLNFDEFVHGLRDRPDVVELLLRPPTLWITILGFMFVGLIVWHFAPRFGKFQPEARPRRRSKEEFLDAMASLLERKGDSGAAYAVVRDDILRSVEAELGLPNGIPVEQLVATAISYRGKQIESTLKPLETVLRSGASQTTFLTALNELENTRDRFFGKRNDR